ncbi:4'-phosphopantetheinyl transferase superfamily protein [Streptomyces sp. NPDC048483]|uniref:4'-phosphopantetheinyl transferase family protein n=1 Tax=Streptomyces sp. NPDC048483 TaxID=3154927 RepID=UPI00341B78BE
METRSAASIFTLNVKAHAREAETLRDVLSPAERARADAFRRQDDRDRYQVAHTALRRELSARLGTPPAEISFVRAPCPSCGGPHGRPSLPGHTLHFSLSHAGDVVVLAYAQAPVGVDVEEYPTPVAAAEVGSRLHPRERAELAALPNDRRPEAFARCWTRKEAHLKGIGTGIAEGLSDHYLGTGTRPAEIPGWHIRDLDDPLLPVGYAAAVAVASPR